MNKKGISSGSSTWGGEALIDYAQAQVASVIQNHDGRAVEAPLSPPPGYTLARSVGRGGQGVIYQCVQESTGRLVALKVVHGPIGADGMRERRMTRELEVLAELDHPNIVRVHDGGSAAGMRFIVMDYVDGQPFDEYVRAHECDVADIVRLFVKVCDAVSSAHLHGIVHRDLKPANILVDHHGEPRVLDFGCAKLTERLGRQGRRDLTMTVTGQFIGSLPWASPEQVDGVARDVDVRTDVYALGVVLYHALTGAYPHDIHRSQRRVMDAIVHEDPPRPGKLNRKIDGALDAIVLKCLRKARTQRYQNAGELARDLRRYLDAEPVEAKGDSALYLIGTWARRHRYKATVAIMSLAAAAVYIPTVTVLYRSERAAQKTAREAVDVSRAQIHAQRDMLGIVVNEVVHRLHGDDAASQASQAMLQEAYEGLMRSAELAPDDPSIRADIAGTHQLLGEIAHALNKVDVAEEQFNHALAVREALAVDYPDDPELQSALSISLVKVGDVAGARGRYDEKLAKYLRAWEIDESLVARFPDNLHYRDNLLWSYERLGGDARQRGRLGDAEALFTKQLQVGDHLTRAEPDNGLRWFGLARAQLQLSELAKVMEDPNARLEHALRALDSARQATVLDPSHGEYNRLHLSLHGLVAQAYEAVGDRERAAAYAHAAVSFDSAPRTPDVEGVRSVRVLLRSQRIDLYGALEQGDYAKAEVISHEMSYVAGNVAMLYGFDRDCTVAVADTYRLLGEYGMRMNRCDETIVYGQRALEALRRQPEYAKGDASLVSAEATQLNLLAAAYRREGDLVRSLQSIREAVERLESGIDESTSTEQLDEQRCELYRGMVTILTELGFVDEATFYARRAVELGTQLLGQPGAPPSRIRHFALLLARAPGDLRDAHRAVEMLEALVEGPDAHVHDSMSLAEAYCADGSIEAGMALYKKLDGQTPAQEAGLRFLIRDGMERCGQRAELSEAPSDGRAR